MNEIEKGQLAQTTVQCFTDADGSLANFPGLLKKVIAERVWEYRIHHGREIRLANLRELITLPPIDGWGQDPGKIEAVIRDDAEVLAMFRDAMVEKPGKRAAVISDNVTNKEQPEPRRGNTKSYTLDRLKRKAPDLFKAVCNGEMSANAAAIAAGFRKVKTPFERAMALVPKLTPDERSKLIDALK